MNEKIRKNYACFLCGLAILFFSCIFSGSAHALAKPVISAEGAALYNVTSGEFLFEKNADRQFYPASITKIMTALLVLERSSQSDTVVFTESATANLESGAVSLNLTAGDQISVRDCLYALLLKSANEVANGLAEHVSGSVPAFAELMNARARELGCTGTNFVNPNGLTNAKHLTTPHDMALIARACFEREDFREIERSTVYHFPASHKRPEGTTIVMGHKMIAPGGSLYYPGILGGKTGYTSAAGNTLVTCAERNGVRLIAVVMKSRSTHYTDTKALLDYGFAEAGSGNPKDVQENVDDAVGAVPGSEVAEAKEGPGAGQSVPVGSVQSGVAVVRAVPAEAASEGAAADHHALGTNPASSAAATESGRIVRAVASETQISGEKGSGVLAPGWQMQNGHWIYVRADGSRASGARLEINGYEYWFDETGCMITGWHQDADGNWYYLRPSFGGMKKSCWIQDEGKWYYLGADGRMLRNGIAPDGGRVGEDGVWIEGHA